MFLDAVHFAPHALMDVTAWNCDFLCCSAYKFFGPHVGILYGKREWLESLPAYKVRPCAETLPDRWMTGTQNFAAIAGVGAAVEYLAGYLKADCPLPNYSLETVLKSAGKVEEMAAGRFKLKRKK